MNKLITWTGLFLASLFAMQSHGAGTGAGTTISNTASVSYGVGGSPVTANSETVIVTVQELINVVIVSQDSNKIVSVSSPDTDAKLKFLVTNTGNGNEAFVITPSNLTDDEFEAGLSTSTIYLDDGDGIFEPNAVVEGDTADTAYDNSAPPSIAPDGSITVWVSSTIPDNLNNDDTAKVQVSALSKTFSDAGVEPVAGAVVADNGDDSTDAIYGGSGVALDNATFTVSAIQVTIAKAIGDINDNLGANGTNVSGQAVPGAEVDYSLTITVTGTGDATNVTVTDPLPAELTLKGGTNGVIIVDGVDNTASNGDDDASYDANTRTITVQLGDITAGSADSIITFTTVIQ